MRHIVLTRYNLPLSFNNSNAAEVRSKSSWLKDRKVLFDKYCLPAMRSQTSKNFEWFIGFGPNTPPEYWNYFDDVATPILATSNEDFHHQVIQHMKPGKMPSIRSRVDNDDAFGSTYIETVQNIAAGLYAARDQVGLPHVINFRRGWEVDDKTGSIYKKDYPNSSFFSFLQEEMEREDFFNVQTGNHAQVGKYFGVTNISTEKPMWLISVHGDNIANKISGREVDATKEDLVKYFGSALA